MPESIDLLFSFPEKNKNKKREEMQGRRGTDGGGSIDINEPCCRRRGSIVII